MARTRTQHDARSEADIEAAEAALALPPVLPEPEPLRPTTATLNVPAPTRSVLDRFLTQWLPAVLNRGPIEVPDLNQLRPMIDACKGGINAEIWDRSPAWRTFFGSHDAEAQNFVRSIWTSANTWRLPRSLHDQFVNGLAHDIIEAFETAAELHRQRAAKRQAVQGPAVRAQAAAQLLEALQPFKMAIEAFDRATRNTLPAPGLVAAAQALPHLEAAARMHLQ